MCGFLGEFGSLCEARVFGSLLDLSRRRGPDDQQIAEFAPHVRFGFNRLSIQDLTPAGRQPMQSHSKRWLIVFNGEVYNHLELRQHLPEHPWNGHSDTETVVELIDQFGVAETVQKLDGMFAVAAWDSERNELHLMRDFCGIKPLFYGTSNGTVVFASQYDQVRKHPLFSSADPDPAIIRLFCQQHFVPAPFGLHKGIRQLLPGERVTFNLSGDPQRSRYWEFPEAPAFSVTQLDDAIRQTESSLESSVFDQMLSDVPLGGFLSGGVDSPLVCGLARRRNPALEVFTIGSDSAVHDESEDARAFAEHFELQQHLWKLDGKTVLDEFSSILGSLHEPLADPSIVPTYLLSKLARQHVTVALSGDGGDELFYGYERFWSIGKNAAFARMPNAVRMLLYGADKVYSKNQHINSVIREARQCDAHRGLHCRFRDDSLGRVAPDIVSTPFPGEWDVYDYPVTTDERELVNHIRKAEFYGMMQKTLRKVDLASMENSLEIRVPFLQKTTIDAAVKVDPFLSYGKRKKKEVLKAFLRQMVPGHRDDNVKRGFSVPLGKWIKGPLNNLFRERILDGSLPGHGFRRQELETMLNEHAIGDRDHKWPLFTLLALEKHL